MFFILVFFFINIYVNNVIYWWSIFLLITLVYILLGKHFMKYVSIVNYFIIQEVLGLLFLVFRGLLLQLLVLIMKVGVAPFHFWIFSVVYSLDNYILIWFLTFQKLPFIPVLLLLFSYFFLFIIFIGLVFCYLQIYNIKNFKLILVLSSTESFNWILLGLIFGVFGFIFIVLFYFLNIIFFILFLNRNNFSFLNLETVLVFLNIPIGAVFFVKIFILYLGFFVFDFILFFILFLIFLSSLSFIYWLMIQNIVSTTVFKNSYINLYFFVYFLCFILFFYHFSKSYIILSW